MYFVKKKTTTDNSVKYTTSTHAHDTNYSITQPMNKHDECTVLLVPKLGACDNQSRSWIFIVLIIIIIIIILVIFAIINIIIIIAPKVFFYNDRLLLR